MGERAALAVGWILVIVSSLATLYASVVEECLKSYRRQKLFDSLKPERHARFERLLRREDDFYLVARFQRSTAYLANFFGVLFVVSGQFGSYNLKVMAEAVLVALILSLVFAGLVPAVWARNRSEPTLRALLPGFALTSLPFLPIVRLTELVHAGVARVRGAPPESTPEEEFEGDIADSLHEAEGEGVIGEGEREMISSVIDFLDATVKDAMTPRTKMVCVDVNDCLDAAIALANKHGHTRLPVFEGNRDTIVGVFNVRDALLHWNERGAAAPTIRAIMRKPTFVPESKGLGQLLAEFRAERTQLAVVLDEFGGSSGLITLEDMLEEIVGEIRDEFDENEDADSASSINHVADHILEVSARVKIEDVNNAFACDLPESPEYTSIGGLISTRLGRIPGPGEELPIDGVTLRVLEASERMVKRVRLTRTTPPPL